MNSISTESPQSADYKYVIFSLAQIRAHNLRDVKRDRTLVRGSKRAFDYYTQFQNSRFLCTETARIYLNEVSTESAYIIDYEYPIFSLAQIRRFAVKDMKRPSHKHGHNTRKRDRFSVGKTPPIYLENISAESPSSIDYKYARFRLAQIRRFIL